MGTSRPEVEVVREQHYEKRISEANTGSEESKSVIRIVERERRGVNQNSDNIETNGQYKSEQTTTSKQEEDSEQMQLEMVMTLTQTINNLGGKFEQMGQSFEEKLASIEARHRELESKLAEVRDLDEIQ